MFLKKLKLTNFRNYDFCELNFNSNKNIIVGNNAQGKTNLLEAVFFMATLSSFRALKDSELIKWENDFSSIGVDFFKNETNLTLDLIINPPKKKILKVNGLKKTKYADFLGNIVVVNFGVSDLLLLRGTPSDRRNWLDSAISQIYPAYKERMLKYNKIRAQRNNVLKEFKGCFQLNDYQETSLSVWDEQLAIYGSNIIHLRQKYLKEIQERAYEKHKNISLEKENLLLKYNSTVSGVFDTEKDENLKVEEINDLYKKCIKEKRAEELIRAQTVVGPHRDDILFYLNGVDAKSYASQGQQRTIVLSLKLSELDFVRNIIGEDPILLLDDVMAELDITRQNYLLDSIDKKTQTIITTTDINSFNKTYLEDVEVYNIESGKIIY